MLVELIRCNYVSVMRIGCTQKHTSGYKKSRKHSSLNSFINLGRFRSSLLAPPVGRIAFHSSKERGYDDMLIVFKPLIDLVSWRSCLRMSSAQ